MNITTSHAQAPAWLIDKMQASNVIPLCDFVKLALTDPDHGYYTTGNPIGARGDFVTAPEISPFFGEFVGLWLLQSWQELAWDQPFALVEAGPGHGTLMADILRIFNLRPQALKQLSVHLIEVSPKLRARQKQALSSIIDVSHITWHDDIASLPNLPTLFVGNEFLDALPVDQFVRRHNGWHKIAVKLNDQHKLSLCDIPCSPPQHPLANQAKTNAIIECSKAVVEVTNFVGAHLLKHSGAALFIDYGSLVSTTGSTLQAIHDKAFASPLDHVGQSDLTFHVDFSAITSALPEPLLKATTTQGCFLNDLGLGLRLNQIKQAKAMPEDKIHDLIIGANRLVHPDAMGSLFKVLALSSKPISLPPFLLNQSS